MLVVKKFLELIGDVDLFSIAKSHSFKATRVQETNLVETRILLLESDCEIEGHGLCRWACAVKFDDVGDNLKMSTSHFCFPSNSLRCIYIHERSLAKGDHRCDRESFCPLFALAVPQSEAPCTHHKDKKSHGRERKAFVFLCSCVYYLISSSFCQALFSSFFKSPTCSDKMTPSDHCTTTHLFPFDFVMIP